MNSEFILLRCNFFSYLYKSKNTNNIENNETDAVMRQLEVDGL